MSVSVSLLLVGFCVKFDTWDLLRKICRENSNSSEIGQQYQALDMMTAHIGPCEEDGSSVCGSERYTAAGTSCPRELETLAS
jgi:hypothetical protein